MNRLPGIATIFAVGFLFSVCSPHASAQLVDGGEISVLVNELKSDDYHNRINSVARLTNREPIDQDALTAVITVLANDENPLVRTNAAFGLGGLGPAASPDVVLALVKALYDKSPGVSGMAFSALGNIGPKAKAAIPVLENFANSSDVSKCSSATFALGAVRDGKCIEDLVNPYRGKRNFRACQ